MMWIALQDIKRWSRKKYRCLRLLLHGVSVGGAGVGSAGTSRSGAIRRLLVVNKRTDCAGCQSIAARFRRCLFGARWPYCSSVLVADVATVGGIVDLRCLSILNYR